MHKTLRQREAALDALLGPTTCSISMGGDAPDNSGLNAAALKQAELSQEQLDWFKQLEAESKPQREETQRRQNEISDTQLRLMNKGEALTDEAANRYRTTFQPVEDKLVKDALDYASPARRQAEMGQAMGDVSTQTQLMREGVMRDLADRGVDASSGNAVAALTRMGVQEGANRAAAGNAAGRAVDTMANARLMDAAGIGRGVVGSQATQAGLTMNAGNAAATTSGMANSTGMSGAPLMATGYSGAQSGLAGAASTYGTIGKINSDYSAQEAAGAAGVGKLIGGVGGFMVGGPAGAMAGASMMSDENEKEAIKPASDSVALSQVRAMPVKHWRYKPDSVANDGGQPHTGPMAQAVHAAAGEAAAPGGKRIDLVTMNGITLSAVRALDKKVTQLTKQVAKVKAEPDADDAAPSLRAVKLRSVL